ncbi:MAG: DUF1992 domain-containing protein, partial [Granulosicoccus sp.]|nr:DUF1992 domain-containing protein [Granulosicoccus sp.]
WLAEQRIRSAIRAGEFDNLPGAHKPLPPDALDPLIPAHLRVAMRVIRNSGSVPAEVLLRRELTLLDAQITRRVAATPLQDDNSEGHSGSAEETSLKTLHERRLELLIRLRQHR